MEVPPVGWGSTGSLMKKEDLRVAIVGAGTVGISIGHLLQSKGFDIVAVASRSSVSLERAKGFVKSALATDVVEAAKRANLIFITTNDDQIEPVCQQIAQGGGFRQGDTVFHMSGALSTEVLESARSKRAKVGSIHPLQSFASIIQAIEILPGSTFGVTADGRILPLAQEIVGALGGKAILVRDEDKPLYHAAACATCNYVVALFHYAQSIYKSLGIDNEVSREALLPLVKGTVANIARAEKGQIAKVLTGPIARGDTKIVSKHLEAFDEKLPHLRQLYCQLGVYTTQVAFEKGTIDKEKQQEFLKILKQD